MKNPPAGRGALVAARADHGSTVPASSRTSDSSRCGIHVKHLYSSSLLTSVNANKGPQKFCDWRHRETFVSCRWRSSGGGKSWHRPANWLKPTTSYYDWMHPWIWTGRKHFAVRSTPDLSVALDCGRVQRKARKWTENERMAKRVDPLWRVRWPRLRHFHSKVSNCWPRFPFRLLLTWFGCHETPAGWAVRIENGRKSFLLRWHGRNALIESR